MTSLATLSFLLSFAAWGLVGGLASVFAALYNLTASQTALLVAVPVLLGSLARLPMGMLTDRFGGRLVFTALLAFSSLAAFVVPLTAQLRLAARRRVPHRHGRIVVRGRRGVRVALDAARRGRARRSASTGWGRWGSRWPSSSARSSRPASAGRWCFAAPARCSWSWAVVYFAARAQSPAGRPSRDGRRDGRGPAARADRVAARRLLLPDVRRLRRVLDLPADAAARAVRPGAGGRRIPRRRLRRARHADAAGRRLAGGSDRRRAGAVVGLRRRRAVLAAADVAVDGAVHGRRARRARC